MPGDQGDLPAEAAAGWGRDTATADVGLFRVLPGGFPAVAPRIVALRAIVHPRLEAGMALTVPWSPGSTLVQAIKDLYRDFKHSPPRLL